MNEHLVKTLITLSPVIVLVFLGAFVRKTRILSSVQIEGLQNLAVKIVLPATLFLTFIKLEMEWRYFLLPVFIFLLCVLTYLYGLARSRWGRIEIKSFPFMMSSFEFGMLGITLFSSVFGVEQLGKIALMALGQEFFVWFIMVPRLGGRELKNAGVLKMVWSFITNPALGAIILGLLLNVSGFSRWGTGCLPTEVLFAVLEQLSSMIVPLILIIIGYNMRLQRKSFKNAFTLILQRLLVMAPLAAVFAGFVMKRFLNLDQYYIYGLITLILLPPPFVIPIFLDPKRKDELPGINGILMTYTFFTIILFSLFILALSP